MARPSSHGVGGWCLTAAGYLALTVAATWPLATRLTSAVAVDLGDSLFTAWVIDWVSAHLVRIASGDVGAWAALWQAPIFAPSPDTLTYSEPFIGQAALALPARWLGGPIAAYNLTLIATFALTALTAHGLGHRYTGSHLAGVVAAVTASFNQYRVHYSLAHLHALSLFWWIVAMWAVDRACASPRRAPLVVAAVALILQYYSSNYLLALSLPFSAALTLWSIARHGRLRDARLWCDSLVFVGVVPLVAVWPMVSRYLAMRRSLGIARPLSEVVENSATLAVFAHEAYWLAPLGVLALLGVVVPGQPGGASRMARGVLFVLALCTLVLALGPVVDIGGHVVPGPYAVLVRTVPGFDGLRVPHRFVALGLVFFGVLAGAASAWLVRRWRLSGVAVGAVMALVALDAWRLPFPLETPVPVTDVASPPAYLSPAVAAPGIYRFAAILPPSAVLAELPFGEVAYEIRYTWFTRVHGHRVMNGYSGVLTPDYVGRQRALQVPFPDERRVWDALAPATHVVVHTAAWTDGRGDAVRLWLAQHGATAVANADGAWLYALPSAGSGRP